MKKCYLGVMAILLLIAVPLSAQLPPSGASVGVYFDAEGTISTVTGLFSFPQNSSLDAYVIVYWEAMVGGASYSIAGLPPTVLMVSETWPDGIAVGSAFDGCGAEAGLYLPGFGFYGTPVVISKITLFNLALGHSMTLCIEPHCNYGQIVVSDNQANLFAADGLCGVVGADDTSWGAVKNMYR